MFQTVFIFFLCLCSALSQNQTIKVLPAGHPSNNTIKGTKHFWQSSGKYQGDIALTAEQAKQLASRNGIFNSPKKWKDGWIVVEFDPALSGDQVNTILLALDVLRRQTCVNARYRNAGESDYIFITARNQGCYSYIGHIGGKQDLNLQDPGCFYEGTIVHELLHAYGFDHMQCDPMRDQFVWIYWDNIPVDARHNFNIDYSLTSNGYPYDYNSVMHYTAYAFAINSNSPTILRNREPYYELGSDNGPSYYDLEKLKSMYCW